MFNYECVQFTFLHVLLLCIEFYLLHFFSSLFFFRLHSLLVECSCLQEFEIFFLIRYKRRASQCQTAMHLRCKWNLIVLCKCKVHNNNYNKKVRSICRQREKERRSFLFSFMVYLIAQHSFIHVQSSALLMHKMCKPYPRFLTLCTALAKPPLINKIRYNFIRVQYVHCSSKYRMCVCVCAWWTCRMLLVCGFRLESSTHIMNNWLNLRFLDLLLMLMIGVSLHKISFIFAAFLVNFRSFYFYAFFCGVVDIQFDSDIDRNTKISKSIINKIDVM